MAKGLNFHESFLRKTKQVFSEKYPQTVEFPPNESVFMHNADTSRYIFIFRLQRSINEWT